MTMTGVAGYRAAMRTRLLTLAAVLGLAVVVLPALPASAKTLTPSQLKALQNSLNSGKKLTYSATYVAVNGSQRQTITIAQAPPKSDFSTSSGSAIDTGKATYFCSTSSSSSSSGSTGNSSTISSGGKEQCISEGGTNPLLGLQDLFSPSAAVAALSEAREGAVARALGIKVVSSSGNYGGQSATCVTVSERGKGSGKYCVTKAGILAYASTANNASSNYFELTKYSSKPASSLFSLPAGATTATIPSIPDVSIPDVSIP
jgi:hypothetical protein